MNLLDYLPRRYQATEDPVRTQRRIELGVVVLLLVLCLQLVFGGISLLSMSPPAAIMPSADSIQVPLVKSPESLTAQQRNEILSRPVFWAGRRPVTAVAVREDSLANSAADSQLKGIKLVGVFGGGKSAGIIALVKDKKRRILLGEDIDGWTLDSIDAGEVVLVSGGRRERLTLQRASDTGDAAVADYKPEAGPSKAGAPAAKKQPKGKSPVPAGVPAANGDNSSATLSGGLGLGGGVR